MLLPTQTQNNRAPQFDCLPSSTETEKRQNQFEHPLIGEIPHNKYTNIRKHQLLPPSAWLIIFSRNPNYLYQLTEQSFPHYPVDPVPVGRIVSCLLFCLLACPVLCQCGGGCRDGSNLWSDPGDCPQILQRFAVRFSEAERLQTV